MNLNTASCGDLLRVIEALEMALFQGSLFESEDGSAAAFLDSMLEELSLRLEDGDPCGELILRADALIQHLGPVGAPGTVSEYDEEPSVLPPILIAGELNADWVLQHRG